MTILKTILFAGISSLLAVAAAAQKDVRNTSALPLSQEMSNTSMSLWKDSFTMDASRPARWSYDQGVILKGIEGVWNRTGDAKYFKYIQHAMDVFVTKDGDVRTYKQEDFNIDNVNNARILLFLYKVTN